MKKNICYNNIMFVGPQYKDYRGGIGAVLASYAKHIEKIKFVATYDAHYKLPINIIKFIGAFVHIIYRLLIDRSIRIVHIHGAAKGSFYRMYIVFLFSKFVFRKKVIYHLHASEFREFYSNSNGFIRSVVKHLMENSDLVICLSLYWYQYLDKKFNIKKLHILNNPVHPPVAREYHLEKDCSKLNLLFLGIIGKRKGIFDLLKVILEYRDEYEGKLTLNVGGNGDTVKLKKIIKENRLENIVKFEGWVSKEKKYKLLSTSDVLVLPSYNEGLPMAILEAMSYGLAIISTTVGGIPEVVKDEENGFIFKPGDLEQIKFSLDLLIQNPYLCKCMGENSKSKVENYLTSNVLVKLKDIYCEV